jgi:hypothetical protein
MNEMGIKMRDIVIIAASIMVAGALAGIFGGLFAGEDSPRPISKCEKSCIDAHTDTEQRLNCMLKCIADGK